MIAKQTVVSASLAIGLGGSALAQVATDPPASSDEAMPAPVPAQPRPTPPPPPPPPTGRFQLGLWYSTDDHVGFVARISQSNLFGTGDLLALEARTDGRHQLFETRFGMPHVLDTEATLDATLYNDRRVLPGFVREAVGSQVTLTRSLGDHVHGFVGYRVERVTPELDALPTDARRATDDPWVPRARDLTLASVRAGLAYSTLDSPVLPLRGTSLGATIEVADPRLGSTIELTRITAWANTHQALGPFTVHLGGRVSAVTSVNPAGVPLSERLFLDGSSAIRGFAPGALGPVDPFSAVSIGGTEQLTGSAELEAPLDRRLGVSVLGFYDAAGIFGVPGVGGARVGQSVGFGVRWRSPLGPMELAYAIPFGGPPRLVFGIGRPL